MKVKMIVQSMYHGELLREGKIYTIEEAVAKRWIAAKIAEEVNEN